jgi:hypothetical protein
MTEYHILNLVSTSSPSGFHRHSDWSKTKSSAYRFMVDPHGENSIPHREWIIMFEAVINEVKGYMREQGREDEFIGARVSFSLSKAYRPSGIETYQVIYTTLKSIPPSEMEWYLEDCIALKKEFPHLIAGLRLPFLTSGTLLTALQVSISSGQKIF